MKTKLLAAALAAGFAMSGIFCGTAHAAGSMNVDDAQVLDAKKCQLETWLKFNRDGTERWLMPSCNFSGNLEIAAGGSWQRDEQGLYAANAQLQGKTMFKPLETNSYGVGLIAGVNRQTTGDDRQRGWDTYFKIPLSFSFRDDAFLLHNNLGMKHDGVTGSNRLTWGVGTETRILDNLSFIGEVFGENKGKPAYQAGIRASLVPEKVQLDLTFGNNFGRETRGQYVVLGLRFISPAFLP
ncbi:hypothetical protein PQR62_02625 [Herbaspirillum lusitanum]|jgi:hypothetical protein|uniref:Transporter n=1 Tax=Herbaspirillum lusitanum TaxID=213312 RepID=A0ABW9A5E8_9BURK